MTVEDGKGLLSACPGSSSVNGSFEIYFLHTCEAMGSLLAEKIRYSGYRRDPRWPAELC